MPSARTLEAKAWQNLYKSTRWLHLRAQQLRKQPLCERCLSKGYITPATIAHHVEAHKGNPIKFYHGTLASSCKPCHDRDEQSIERTGYDKAVGEDGFPLDPSHPFNKIKNKSKT